MEAHNNLLVQLGGILLTLVELLQEDKERELLDGIERIGHAFKRGPFVGQRRLIVRIDGQCQVVLLDCLG